ncbi:MAG: SgcJ/EcaC family oxidoreductase [Planctomycetota bacterium]
MTSRKMVLALGVMVALAVPRLDAQDGDDNPELAAIRQTSASYLKAFDAGDAQAVAAHWTEDGDYLGQDGQGLRGREAIEKAFAKFFSEAPGAKLRVHVESIHFPEENVAIEIGDSLVTRSAASEGEVVEERARYKAVLFKTEGAWKIQSLEEGPALPASNYKHLKDLEWMIGTWVDEEVAADDTQPSVVVYTQSRWSTHRNFMVRTFKATVDNRVITTGTQRIGWFEPAKEIRSWTFDSDGGITMGVWSQNGETWVVKAEQVMRDGKKAMETATATIDDPHAHTWQLTDRSLEGQALPDLVVKAYRHGTKQK